MLAFLVDTVKCKCCIHVPPFELYFSTLCIRFEDGDCINDLSEFERNGSRLEGNLDRCVPHGLMVPWSKMHTSTFLRAISDGSWAPRRLAARNPHMLHVCNCVLMFFLHANPPHTLAHSPTPFLSPNDLMI